MENNLKNIMEEKGLTVIQLVKKLEAEEIPITRQAVYKWLNQGMISPPYIPPLCRALECKREELLTITNN